MLTGELVYTVQGTRDMQSVCLDTRHRGSVGVNPSRDLCRRSELQQAYYRFVIYGYNDGTGFRGSVSVPVYRSRSRPRAPGLTAQLALSAER